MDSTIDQEVLDKLKEVSIEEMYAYIFGRCPQCHKVNVKSAWCDECDISSLVAEFDKWTSGNDEIDRFIQENQRHTENHNTYIEWIPFNRLEDVKMTTGEYPYSAKWLALEKLTTDRYSYSAKWMDGLRYFEKVGRSTFAKRRTAPVYVYLMKINEFQDISERTKVIAAYLSES